MRKETFTAVVIKGKGRGKEIGFPTLNLKVPTDFSLKEGIYACWVILDNNPARRHMGALHYGPVPVFDEMIPSLEVHILGYREDRTPKKLEVTIAKFLRDVAFFDSVEKLIDQIEQDVAETRRILSSPRKDHLQGQ